MDINTTVIPVVDPLLHTVKYFVNFVQILVGGIFGLYLILVILRWHEARTLKKLMQDVRDELVELNSTVKRLEKLNLKRK